MKAIAKKPNQDSAYKKRHDTVYSPLKNAYSTNSGYQASIIQLKPICPCDGGCPRCVPVIQPKLIIGQPDDKYEREADKVADEVMRMPVPEVQPKPTRPLSQGPSCGDEDMEGELIQARPVVERITPLVQRQVEEEEEEKEKGEEILQTKENPGQTSEVTSDLESRIQSLKGSGQPLPKSARAFFEPRFGHDFSQVRIHSNPQAAEIARALNARAFTVGRDIVFGTGQYSPDKSEGKRLLTHELTHVIQQSRISSGSSQNTLLLQEEVSAAELELTGGRFYTEQIEYYGPPAHAKGHIGEIEAAHILGRKYGPENIIMAPKKLVTEAGFDTIVYDSANSQVLFIDNKATKGERIGTVTALTKNIERNTARARAFVQSLPEGMGGIDPKLKKKVLDAIDNKRIKLRVTTAFGKGERLATRLTEAGVEIEPLTLEPSERGGIVERVARGGKRVVGRVGRSVRAAIGRVPGVAWFGILIALDIAVSSYVREQERLRMAKDWSSILPKLRDELYGMQERAYTMQTQNPLDFVFANMTVEVVWFRYHADGERRRYVRTDLISLDLSTEDKYEEKMEERGAELVMSVVVSQEFFELTKGLIAANLETVRFLGDTEIRAWLRKNERNMPAISAIPTQEKVRLIDRLISGTLSDDDFWAIWRICFSVTDREEASDIKKEIFPITVDIEDDAMKYRVRSVLIDMYRAKVREYSTYWQ